MKFKQFMQVTNQSSSASSRLPRVAVVGASGYSGEELVGVLAGHPGVELAVVTSRQWAGQPVNEVLRRFRGRLSPELHFQASDPATLAADADLAVCFLALPHGVAAEYAIPLVGAGRRVIDLSADFRLGTADTYQSYYGQPHPAPDLLARSAYVIPEIAPAGWQDAALIAAPGCYPTSIITPLVPLLREGLIDHRGIIANSLSGITGAGRKLTEDLLFAERAESVRAYGLPRHRHLSEIEEQLGLAAGQEVVIQFHPHLIPMRRGIHSTISVPSKGADLDQLYACWDRAFADCPFVDLLPAGQFPETADVVGSNRLAMAAVLDARTGRFVITTAEDNLLKGAGGQAVQIMNLWLGLPETAGLI